MHNSWLSQNTSPYGHFTTFLLRNGGVLGWDLHLSRLQNDSQSLFGAPISESKLCHAFTKNSLLKNYLKLFQHQNFKSFDPNHNKKSEDAVPVANDIRVRINVSTSKLKLDNLTEHSNLNISIVAEPYLLQHQVLSPLKVCTVPFKRNLAEHKHFDLCAVLYQRRQAQLIGFDDALFYDFETGFLSEGPTWNLGIVTDSGEVFFPSKTKILNGVTMQLLAKFTEVKYSPIFINEFGLIKLKYFPSLKINTLFAMNSIWGIRPISLINQQKLVSKSESLNHLETTYQNLTPTALSEIITNAGTRK